MNAKTISESTVNITHVMMPHDANPAGIIHGGVIMKQIDNAAGVVAVRHTRKICVTASIDRIDFHNPSHIGNLISFKASLNMVNKSSMEIGVRVEREDLLTGEVAHIASAYLTFVALGEDFKPTEDTPELKTESDDEIRRNKEALKRREQRLSQKNYEYECQMDMTNC
ncbi:MAG: acyl-CoA thioesterase [Desulfobacterales bacterium]|nr:acyl-CoA thioesterase [Desulfobacterales bacterium]MCP4161700.1 acyl-CoA thioesterase [Deltaproteobacteria bacterium]